MNSVYETHIVETGEYHNGGGCWCDFVRFKLREAPELDYVVVVSEDNVSVFPWAAWNCYMCGVLDDLSAMELESYSFNSCTSFPYGVEESSFRYMIDIGIATHTLGHYRRHNSYAFITGHHYQVYNAAMDNLKTLKHQDATADLC